MLKFLRSLNTHFFANLGAGMQTAGMIVGGASLHGSTGSLNIVSLGASALVVIGGSLMYLGRPKTVTSTEPAK